MACRASPELVFRVLSSFIVQGNPKRRVESRKPWRACFLLHPWCLNCKRTRRRLVWMNISCDVYIRITFLQLYLDKSTFSDEFLWNWRFIEDWRMRREPRRVAWRASPELGFCLISPFIVQGVPRRRVERRKPWRACLLRQLFETFELQKGSCRSIFIGKQTNSAQVIGKTCLLKPQCRLQKDEKKIGVDKPCLWHLSSRYYSATFSVELTFFAELFCNRLKL